MINQFMGSMALVNSVVASLLLAQSLRGSRLGDTLARFGAIALIVAAVFAASDFSQFLGFETVSEGARWIAAAMATNVIGLTLLFATKMRALGAVCAALSSLFYVMAIALTETYSFSWQFHVAGAVMGEIHFVGSAIVSTLFLWQHYSLKRRMLKRLAHGVPALDKLERILFTSLWCGFVYLTMAVISGALFSAGGEPLGRPMAAKTAWALGVWVWYLLILMAYQTFRATPKHIAQMSLVGTFLFAVTFFGLIFFRV